MPYGFTTPSVTSVVAVGGAHNDLAFNVGFADGVDEWFAPEVVDFVDHAAGTEMQIGEHRFVRSADGEWQQR